LNGAAHQIEFGCARIVLEKLLRAKSRLPLRTLIEAMESIDPRLTQQLGEAL
jgi:hypothetical protein